MGRPRQVTDEQILSATRRVVLEHGAQISLDVVAQEVGVTSPALLKRYGTRHALLIAALRPDDAEFARLFEVPPDDRPFAEQLESMLDGLSKYFNKTFPCMMALRECGIPREELEQTIKLPPIVTGIRAMTRWLGLMSKRGLIETDAHESAATAIIGAVSTRTISRHLAKLQASTRSQREHQQELAEMFARALGAKTPKPPKKEPRRRPAKARPRTRTAQS